MDYKVVNLFQIWGREKSMEKILKATAKLRDLNKPKQEDKLSDKAQRIKEKCLSFGPTGNKFAALFSILLEEEIVIKNVLEKYPFIPSACIIPVLKHKDHSYKLDEPIFMIISDNNQELCSCIKASTIDGNVGNYIEPLRSIVIIPEESEVINYVNEMFDILAEKGISDKGFGKEVKVSGQEDMDS
jgi:hypothetical protein